MTGARGGSTKSGDGSPPTSWGPWRIVPCSFTTQGPETRANIDHLAIASSGWVIDAKNYAGMVEHRDIGGWLRSDLRTYVGGRDRTKIGAGMGRQLDVVRTALDGDVVPVHRAVCFIEAERKLFARPFQHDGVWIIWATKLAEMIAEPGPLSLAEVTDVANLLATALPPVRHRRVVIPRGGVYWADLGEPAGSRPAKRRPVLVISGNSYNRSRIATVFVAVVTSNTQLATMPGNVFLPTNATGLPRDSVVNVAALVTLNQTDLAAQAGTLSPALMQEVDRGLQRVLEF